jgi:DNA end-binding protein Ku
MAYRAVWKGFLRLALITCPVKLYAATGEAERQKFTQVNGATGNKVSVRRVDSVTGNTVENDSIRKGVEVATSRYAIVTDEEIEDIAPPSATIAKREALAEREAQAERPGVIVIEELVKRDGIPWLYPDTLYYLGPDGLAAGEAFALIRDGIRRSRMVALGQLTLGTREHLVMMEPGKTVLRLSTLRYATEVRAEEDCFPGLAALAAPEEFADPVAHILDRRKVETFDATRFTDRYAAALSDLVIAKVAGKMVARRTTPPPALLDLAKAVRRSARYGGKNAA